MVGLRFVVHDAGRLFHNRRIDAVQLQRARMLARRESAQPQRLRIARHLQRARMLARRESAQPQRLRIARHQCARRDHLRHIQPIGPVFLAQYADRPVRHAGHRREHDRRTDGQRTEPHRCERMVERGRSTVRPRIELRRLIGGIHYCFVHASPFERSRARVQTRPERFLKKRAVRAAHSPPASQLPTARGGVRGPLRPGRAGAGAGRTGRPRWRCARWQAMPRRPSRRASSAHACACR